jgi:hypothetical protein
MKRAAMIALISLMNSSGKSQEVALSLLNAKEKYSLTSVNEKSGAKNNFALIPGHKQSKIFFTTSANIEPGHLSKIYVKLYGGYGIFTPGSFRVNTVYFLHDTAVKVQMKKGLGNGARYGGGLGFVMNDFLNFGIDAEYHKGSWEEDVLNARVDNSNYNIKTSKIDYKTFSITPYVVFKALAKPKYFLYNKLGVLWTLPFTLTTTLQSNNASQLILENDLNTFVENVSSTTTEKFKISSGVGLNVALGINHKVNERLRVFGEVFGNYSALSPKNSLKVDYNKTFASLSFNSGNDEPLVTKQISVITTNTTFKKGGSLPVEATYIAGPPGTSDDYTLSSVRINTLAHQFTINMAVLGVNLGIIYRL